MRKTNPSRFVQKQDPKSKIIVAKELGFQTRTKFIGSLRHEKYFSTISNRTQKFQSSK